MLNGKFTATQCSQEIDFGLAEEVVALPLESGVGLLLDNNDDVTGNDTRGLIALAVEFDLLAALHSLVDVNLEDLPLRVGLLAVTSLASVLGVHHLAGSLTFSKCK